MSGRPADGTRMATAAAGTETPAATPKQHDAAGKVEAVRTVTTTIVQDGRIADTAAGSGIPAAILRLPAVGGRTVADKQGCVRPSGRAHRRLAATCKNCCATRPPGGSAPPLQTSHPVASWPRCIRNVGLKALTETRAYQIGAGTRFEFEPTGLALTMEHSASRRDHASSRRVSLPIIG